MAFFQLLEGPHEHVLVALAHRPPLRNQTHMTSKASGGVPKSKNSNRGCVSFECKSVIVLKRFRFVRNQDSDSLTFFGHFAGMGTGIGAKMNKKIVFPIHDSSFQR